MTKNPSCQMCANQNYTSPSSSDDASDQNLDFPVNALTFSTAVVIALLSPAAILGNALILATIWKGTFLKTSFHFIVSGLAFTDLLTGLIAQPFYASHQLLNATNPAMIQDNPEVVKGIGLITGSSTFLLVNVSVAIMTVLSVERWLHMSRRSLTTPHRRYFAAIAISLFPVPSIVFYILALSEPDFYHTLFRVTITNFSFTYLIISFAYFKVYQIIRRHQLQIQANGTSQNFGQPAIDLVKYKKSVATMLYIFLLFSTCFLPFMVSIVVALTATVEETKIASAKDVSLVFVYLSSSLNPVLYLWRMRDIRSGLKQLLAMA